MPPTWLTLDRGNTTLDGMWHRDPPERRRVDPSDPGGVADLLETRSHARGEAAGVAALSVVAGALDSIEKQVVALGLPFLIAGRDLPCPLATVYSDPSTLGVDRWVGAFAAHRLYGGSVVVDCGTAVTVNLVSADGDFLGGAIGVGAGTMVAALRMAAPALPRADLDREIRLPAADSEGAVDAGVQVGFCAAVDRLVEDARSGAGLAESTLVVTGGYAPLYLRHGRQSGRHHPDLLHQGLRWLAETHSSNS